VVAFAVVATLVAIPLVTRDPGGDPGIEPNSIGVLDPESGDVTATVELEDRPGSVVASADAVWVTNPDIGTVTRIDPDEQEVRDRIQVGENPTGIAVGFDAVWVLESGEPSVSRISPDTNTVVDRIGVGNGPVDIAVGEGGVWVSNRFDGTISRIDPDAGKVVKTIPVGLDPGGIAIGFGSVWVGLAGANTVVRVDPQTNEVKQSILVNAPGALAVGADAIWVVNTLVDTTSSIDPEAGRVASVLEVGDGPADITVLDGTVWVANEGDGTLSRIAADAASAHRVVIGSVPQGLAGVNGDLWISVRGTVTSHRGGTLRLVSKEGPQTFDSTIAYDFISWRVSHVIGDGLLASKLVGGAEGWTLVPDLAISLPSQTDGGRTYAFQVRPGIRYSNGELVVPGDFRRAIERGFRVDNDYIRLVYRGLFRGLIGSQACTEEPATCDLSRGIVTDDEAGTVTFHLVAPDSELPFKLTMPFAYPVPSSVPLEEQARSGTPGTGPYMLEAPMTDDGLVLVRNPYFRSWSAAAQPGGYVDRIEWTFGIEPEAQIVAVAEGRADLAYDADQYRRLGETLVRFPAQVYTSPFATTFFVVLNTQVPPFDDVRVRRAINFALDRDRVVQIFGGERAALPTCQQLPPNFPGYEPYCPYTLDPGEAGTWSAPDMDEARRLVHRSGTMGTRIAFEYPRLLWGSDGAALGNYLVKLLEELGYRARVKTAAVGPFYQPGHEFQMGLDAWGLDYPAASNFIANRFKCEASLPPSSEFCDPEIDTMIERATRVQTGDQAAASKLWSGIDRQIVDQAPFVWLANPITVNFVSVRVGNYQWSPVWEVLLTQIWVL
jgi:peptide/nickel transport system substrate-binding protein